MPVDKIATEAVSSVLPSLWMERPETASRLPGRIESALDAARARGHIHGRRDAAVHGFRTAFRDWVGNETHFPREVAAAALAHVVGGKAEQAYRRSDALKKRRQLMQAWAIYCELKGATRGAVLSFKKTAGKAK